MPKYMLPFHDHPLKRDYKDVDYPDYRSRDYFCELCSSHGGAIYRCTKCTLVVHERCVEEFLIDQPFRCNHFVKVFMSKSLGDGNHHCHFCLKNDSSLFACCTICNITVDRRCLISPPPLTIFEPKHHKHSLTLLLRLVTFTCNACGLEGDRNPYVCLECNLMVHKDCIEHLPRVISINRHDHRISHTFHLGQAAEGDRWECGVCRKTIDWVYGAFKCSRCPNYAVHSKCATRKEVWDGEELEDDPEEEEEIEDPFTVINENGDIIHFTHDNHILQRLDDNSCTDMRCECCVLPINDDPCFKCMICEFVLHKACANLPRKKRHFLHNHKLILQADKDLFGCPACETASNGFRYVCCEDRCKYKFACDVRCGSVSEPFRHDLHPQHPLYWTLQGSRECKACLKKTKNPLSCMDCDYALCMACATLPRKVKNRCDDHFLTLSQGAGNASGDVWCDICETKMDPRVRYYTCHECGITLHIDCVLGDLYYSKEGLINHGLAITYPPYYFEVLPNNSVTRLLCSCCLTRCKGPFLLRETSGRGAICNFTCSGFQKLYRVTISKY